MTVDFTDRAPYEVWYCEYVGRGSDKFYEARVDVDGQGNVFLTKRWGRNPSASTGGQSKQERFGTTSAAIRAAGEIYNKKVAEGYVPMSWPHGQRAVPNLKDREAVLAWLDN